MAEVVGLTVVVREEGESVVGGDVGGVERGEFCVCVVSE